MAKTKKLNPQFTLVVSGYILFVLLIISVLLSTTIPFGRMLFDPRVLHYNVALLMVALTVGALLPAFLGYVIGDSSVKSKSKIRHHFSGILFGLLAFWIMLIFSSVVSISVEHFVASSNAKLILINSLPSVVVAIITSILAVSHVRSGHAKRDIIEYKPYSIALIGSIILLPVMSLMSTILAQNAFTVDVFTFMPFIIIAVFGAISYVTLRKSGLNVLVKMTWSAVSLTVAYVSAFVLLQLVTSLSYFIENKQSMEFQTAVDNIGWVLALIFWIIFWRLQVKSLSK